jgi:hypothetical protein
MGREGTQAYTTPSIQSQHNHIGSLTATRIMDEGMAIGQRDDTPSDREVNVSSHPQSSSESQKKLR